MEIEEEDLMNTAEEMRRTCKTLRRADYTGKLEVCSRCGSAPRLYVVEPRGTYLKWTSLKTETFFAVRCTCGETGGLRSTGKNIMGKYIDELKAATQAADVWNREQMNVRPDCD